MRRHWFGPGYRVAGCLFHSWQRSLAVRHSLELRCPLVAIGRDGSDLSTTSHEDLVTIELASAGMGPAFAMLVNAQMCRDWMASPHA